MKPPAHEPSLSAADAVISEIMNSGIAGQDDKLALFRAADGKRRQLTPAGYRAHSMRQMLKRRLEDAGLPHLFSPHSFRVAVVTHLLNQNVPLEDVQYLAGLSNPRTTQIYDRRRRRVTQHRRTDFDLKPGSRGSPFPHHLSAHRRSYGSRDEPARRVAHASAPRARCGQSHGGLQSHVPRYGHHRIPG